jgi:hypothetical protein
MCEKRMKDDSKALSISRYVELIKFSTSIEKSSLKISSFFAMAGYYQNSQTQINRKKSY